ncbi:MAG: redoxin domain-containing protein [Patescibacteria group bacterium]
MQINFKMGTRRVLWVFLTTGFVILGLYLLLQFSPKFLEQFGASRESSELRAPDFTLQNLAGENVKLSDFGGKIVLLNFWTSWNEVSLEQLDVLNDFYAAEKQAGIIILAINSLEKKIAVEGSLRQKDIDFQILLDGEGEVGELYSIGMLPKTILINESGLILKQFIGPLTQNDLLKIISGTR